MDKQIVFFDTGMSGIAKDTGKPYKFVKFFQIVLNRWGKYQRVEANLQATDETVSRCLNFVEENNCLLGDLVEIGVKVSNNLSRSGQLLGIIRVVERSPLIKWSVEELDIAADNEFMAMYGGETAITNPDIVNDSGNTTKATKATKATKGGEK